jgi:hypothetical protein
MERSTLRPRHVALVVSRALLCALVLLVSVHAQAQTPPLDLSLSPTSCASPNKVCTDPPARFNEQTNYRESSTSVSHDGKFNVVIGAFITAAGADLAVSMYQIGRGAAREGAFGAQWQDSPVAFAVSKSAMTAAFVYGLQRVRKIRPKTALVLGIAATAAETWLVARSANMPAPEPAH